MLTAWGDESGSIPELDPHSYLLATALVEEEDLGHIRATMLSLKLDTEPKLHWHGSSPERRMKLVETVAALPIAGLVVVRTEEKAKDRRHRRKCLEYLLPQLAEMPCSTITLESRNQLDASDRDIVDKFRASKVISPTLRINHKIGRQEPLLWIADIVCGAVVQSRVGNPEYLAVITHCIDLTHI